MASDPDLVFRENGLEFVLGGAPLTPEFGIGPELGQVSDRAEQFATLSFVAAESNFDDVVVTVEACHDASSWTPVASLLPRSIWQGPGLVTTEPLPGGGRVRIVVRDAESFGPEHPRFLRLSVTLRRDRDADGMSDQYEEDNGLDPDVADAELDRDGDGLTNLIEHDLKLRANRLDSDGDGWSDGFESAIGQDPTTPAPGIDAHLITKLIIHLPAR